MYKSRWGMNERTETMISAFLDKARKKREREIAINSALDFLAALAFYVVILIGMHYGIL